MPFARTVTLKKAAGERTKIGLQQGTKCVRINSVQSSSPLAGLVHPGDIIQSVSGMEATSAKDCSAALVEETGERETYDLRFPRRRAQNGSNALVTKRDRGAAPLVVARVEQVNSTVLDIERPLNHSYWCPLKVSVASGVDADPGSSKKLQNVNTFQKRL